MTVPTKIKSIVFFLLILIVIFSLLASAHYINIKDQIHDNIQSWKSSYTITPNFIQNTFAKQQEKSIENAIKKFFQLFSHQEQNIFIFRKTPPSSQIQLLYKSSTTPSNYLTNSALNQEELDRVRHQIEKNHSFLSTEKIMYSFIIFPEQYAIQYVSFKKHDYYILFFKKIDWWNNSYQIVYFSGFLFWLILIFIYRIIHSRLRYTIKYMLNILIAITNKSTIGLQHQKYENKGISYFPEIKGIIYLLKKIYANSFTTNQIVSIKQQQNISEENINNENANQQKQQNTDKLISNIKNESSTNQIPSETEALINMQHKYIDTHYLNIGTLDVETPLETNTQTETHIFAYDNNINDHQGISFLCLHNKNNNEKLKEITIDNINTTFQKLIQDALQTTVLFKEVSKLLFQKFHPPRFFLLWLDIKAEQLSYTNNTGFDVWISSPNKLQIGTKNHKTFQLQTITVSEMSFTKNDFLICANENIYPELKTTLDAIEKEYIIPLEQEIRKFSPLEQNIVKLRKATKNNHFRKEIQDIILKNIIILSRIS